MVILLAFVMMPMVTLANDTITVTIDGQAVEFADQGPVIVGGRTLVPVGEVFESLGFAPNWRGSTRTATLARHDFEIVIIVDSATFTTNGVEYALDEPAQIINGRVMLPIRAVLESVGYELDWVGATRTVVITTGATVVPQSQIRRHLGVDYTIQPREYTIDWGNGIFRWQFVELSAPLNVSSFPGERIDGMLPTEAGDVFIMTLPDGYVILFIDIGPYKHNNPDWSAALRHYNAIILDDIQLNPIETVDWMSIGWQQEWQERQTLALEQLSERLEHLNMSRQYTSDNFYWYSTDAYSKRLSDMAMELEDRLPELLDALGITLSQRITVLYYSAVDYFTTYDMTYKAGWYRGHLTLWGLNIFSLTRPSGSTAISDSAIELLVHETVHVLQHFYLANFEEMERLSVDFLGWVAEGTATYFERRGPYLSWSAWPEVRTDIRNNRIPTLDYLEDEFYADGAVSYVWAATIIEFISDVFGMEYVVEINRLHGDFEGIFGFSKDEFERQWHQWLRDSYARTL